MCDDAFAGRARSRSDVRIKLYRAKVIGQLYRSAASFKLAGVDSEKGSSMADLTCPKCQNAMEEGFTPDRTERSYGAVFLSTWFEGPPTTGFLRSIKLKGRRQLPISVYRCTSCGYLESYAYTAP